jgi:hypothetical protein
VVGDLVELTCRAGRDVDDEAKPIVLRGTVIGAHGRWLPDLFQEFASQFQ